MYCISHFETMANDVLSLYLRVTGQELDMTISDSMEDDYETGGK